MDVPQPIIDRVQTLSDELGVALSVNKWWDNEFGSGYYCRAHAVVLNSQHVRIEFVCSVAIDTKKDDVDLFVLVNGVRVAPVTDPWHYLHQDGNGPFRSACDDMAYDFQTDLETLLLRNAGDDQSG